MLDSLRQRRFRSSWLPLLLVAVLARALLPQGFMPAVQDGVPGLQICGPAALLLAGDEAQGSNSSEHTRELCPFALATALAPPPVLPVVALGVAAVDVAVLPFASLLAPAPFARAHPPRGPPASV